jgi:hypothetical protein
MLTSFKRSNTANFVLRIPFRMITFDRTTS